MWMLYVVQRKSNSYLLEVNVPANKHPKEKTKKFGLLTETP